MSKPTIAIDRLMNLIERVESTLSIYDIETFLWKQLILFLATCSDTIFSNQQFATIPLALSTAVVRRHFICIEVFLQTNHTHAAIFKCFWLQNQHQDNNETERSRFIFICLSSARNIVC